MGAILLLVRPQDPLPPGLERRRPPRRQEREARETLLVCEFGTHQDAREGRQPRDRIEGFEGDG